MRSRASHDIDAFNSSYASRDVDAFNGDIDAAMSLCTLPRAPSKGNVT